ncbi:GNAT family N-acetyltransferase [Pseudonocardia sp.]|uniref:GNAT family N-acetyltransferase n=1 Tax=Pseudonocardia sp. TaxID=60912 RepID=UPI00260A94C0|nr:GNAT family N-acetyltransferase [Pseudonocardia sp.]
MAEILRTERLIVREWEPGDAPAALEVYGRAEVARWLTPAMERVTDEDAMGRQLRSWIEETREGESGLGHWAVLTAEGALVGGVGLHLLPVEEQDVEIGWQLAPAHWGRGYAVEAGAAVIGRAFGLDVDEVFALVRPGNARGARTARSVGMSWVGETDKYYGLRLEVFRVRSSDPRP